MPVPSTLLLLPHDHATDAALTDTMAPLEFFKLLADETRLASLLLIAKEIELCVCELATALKLSQPKISRHLAMLRKNQLLLDRRQGQWVFYRLNPMLPGWATQNIALTLEQNPQLLTPLLANLSAMGDRPTRTARCCAEPMLQQ